MFFKSKKEKKSPLKNRGFSIVEIIVSTAILTVVLFSLIVSLNDVVVLNYQNGKKIEALFFVEDGLEVARWMRDNDWAIFYSIPREVPITLDHYVGGVNKITEAGFTRTFTLRDVYRDGNDDIAETGTLDPNTLQVDITVSWDNPVAISSVTLTTFFSNIF